MGYLTMNLRNNNLYLAYNHSDIITNLINYLQAYSWYIVVRAVPYVRRLDAGLLTPEPRVQSRVTLNDLRSGQSSTGLGFSAVFSC